MQFEAAIFSNVKFYTFEKSMKFYFLNSMIFYKKSSNIRIILIENKENCKIFIQMRGSLIYKEPKFTFYWPIECYKLLINLWLAQGLVHCFSSKNGF
jgi:hypothetical protein